MRRRRARGADGEVGELWVKGDSRAIGYWQRLDDTMHAFRGEWYVSGDMLRTKRRRHRSSTAAAPTTCSRVSGKWLSPGRTRELPAAARSCREVAVVGVKNADGLVKPCAFVVSDQASSSLAG